MCRIYLTLFMSFVLTLAFPQKMKNLYKYVIEDDYKRLLKNKYISMNDTVYYFNSWNCNKDTSIFDYEIKINNQYIQLMSPKVNTLKRAALGNLFFAPEIDNQYIIISFVDYGVYYYGENDIRFNNAGKISYFFSYNKEKNKYVFLKRKEFRF